MLAGSNIGAVCLTNTGLNVSSYQQGWITHFSTSGSSGEAVQDVFVCLSSVRINLYHQVALLDIIKEGFVFLLLDRV